MKKSRFLLFCLLLFCLSIPVFAQQGDDDQDGFPNGQDACPNRAAPNSNDGCPPRRNTTATEEPEQPSDQDGDGMIDVLDNCPMQGGPAQNAGCPNDVTPVPQGSDSDGDGFPDEQDVCPNQAGSASGCDLVVIEDDGDCRAAPEAAFRVNIREAASETANIIGQLLPNESKPILGIEVSSNTPQNQSIWLRLDIGFINSSVSRIGGNCEDVVSDDEGQPTMTGIFALEWDCSTTPRVIIISDESPADIVRIFSPWRVYPDENYEVIPRPTVPDHVTEGNVIIGTPCDDLIIGTHEADIIDGLGGNDLIVGLFGYDALVGNEGNDQLLAMSLPPLGTETNGNILIGGNGEDRLHAASSAVERLDGGAGNDRVFGNGTDQLYGRDGDDRLSGGTLANGGNGIDTITGTDGNDRLHGGAGNDRIQGGLGDDIITGGDGPNSLNGGLGNDTITGGNERDTINAHHGSDTVHGGDGNDFIIFYYGGRDRGDGGNGSDRIDISDPTYEFLGIERALWMELTIPEEGGYFLGGNGDDYINAYRIYRTVYTPIKGGDGNDMLRGGTYLDGGSGDDSLSLYSDTEAHGGSGNDSFAVISSPYTAVLMYGEGGDDNMIGNNSVDIIFGGEGNDRMVGGLGEDYLNGGNGDDTIYGGMTLPRDWDGRFSTDHINYIDSGAGRDTVDGGQGGIPERTHYDTCIVDSADTFTNCEVRTWPGTFMTLAYWQEFFNLFGL